QDRVAPPRRLGSAARTAPAVRPYHRMGGRFLVGTSRCDVTARVQQRAERTAQRAQHAPRPRRAAQGPEPAGGRPGLARQSVLATAGGPSLPKIGRPTPQAITPLTTLPKTSVRRKSRPL